MLQGRRFWRQRYSDQQGKPGNERHLDLTTTRTHTGVRNVSGTSLSAPTESQSLSNCATIKFQYLCGEGYLSGGYITLLESRSQGCGYFQVVEVVHEQITLYACSHTTFPAALSA